MLIIFAFVNSHAKIEKDEILGLWLFDDRKGNALKDSSGNDNHSKLIDGPKWVAGQFGKALAFDAAEKQRVEVDNSKTLNPTKQISILAWEYLEDKGGNRRFLQKSASGGDNQYRLLLEWGNFRFDAGPGVTPNTVDVPIFSEKKWHHVAGIYDGKEITLYIDGSKEASWQKVTWCLAMVPFSLVPSGQELLMVTTGMARLTKSPSSAEGSLRLR